MGCGDSERTVISCEKVLTSVLDLFLSQESRRRRQRFLTPDTNLTEYVGPSRLCQTLVHVLHAFRRSATWPIDRGTFRLAPRFSAFDSLEAMPIVE